MDFIVDRTAADVAERSDVGYYQAADLNRVETGTDYVNDLRQAVIGSSASITTKNDWREPAAEAWDSDNAPTAAQCDRILQNIRDVVSPWPDCVALVPMDMDGMTVVDANNIEKALDMAQQKLTGIRQAWVYAGTEYCGGAYA